MGESVEWSVTHDILSGTLSSQPQPVCCILKSWQTRPSFKIRKLKKKQKKKTKAFQSKPTHKLRGTELSESAFPWASSRLVRQDSVCLNLTDRKTCSGSGVKTQALDSWCPKLHKPSHSRCSCLEARADIPAPFCVSVPLSYLRVL